MTVPCGVEEFVPKPQNQDVLDHLLTEVVVDTEDLLLLPVRVQSLLEVPGALKILTERLFNLYEEMTVSKGYIGQGRIQPATHNNTGKTTLGVAVALQLLGHGDENTRGQRHVEDAVVLLAALATLLDLLEVLVEVDKRLVLVVLTGDVGAQLAELV